MRKSLFIILLFCCFGITNAQNVGIGTANPIGPLDFGNTQGNKIVLWGNATGPHYGIGVQPGQMRVYTNLPADNIGFGIGRSGAFAQNLRVTGSGRVGIYVLDPARILDVGGRIKLTAVDTFYYDRGEYVVEYKPSYIFFNNANNTAIRAKLGPSDAISGNGFSINYSTRYGFHDYSSDVLRLGLLQVSGGQGRLAVNGNIGVTGQVLRSKGANGAAEWTNTIGPDMYNNSSMANTGGLSVLTNTLQLIRFNKLAEQYDYWDNTYELKVPSKLLVRFNMGAIADECTFCSPTVFDLVITDNGNIVRTFRYSVQNGANPVSKTGSALLTLPVGLHKLGMGGYIVSGPEVKIGNGLNRMTVQVIPSYN